MNHLDPVTDPWYNIDQIVENCVLIEEHLAVPSKRCYECIYKHGTKIAALVDEALTLDKDNTIPVVMGERFAELAQLARVMRDACMGGADPATMSQCYREVRKLLAENVRRRHADSGYYAKAAAAMQESEIYQQAEQALEADQEDA